MKRWQRKQRIKEIKKNQKEARKRKQQEAQAANSPAGDGRESGVDGCNVVSAASAPESSTADASQPCAVETRQIPSPGGQGYEGAPKLLPAYTVDEAVKDVSLAVATARHRIDQADYVDADEAALILSRAARNLSDVIDAGHRALSQVSQQRLKEATEVVTAKAAGWQPAPQGTPQQQPRRGTNPVVTLMKLMVQAVSLLQRVLNRLHPKLRRAA